MPAEAFLASRQLSCFYGPRGELCDSDDTHTASISYFA